MTYAKPLWIMTKIVCHVYITDYRRKTATSTVTASFLTVLMRVSWQLCVAAKMGIRSSTVPRTTRNRKSRFSALLEQIPAARRADLVVDGSAMLRSRNPQMTTSSCPTTFPFLRLQTPLIFHRHGPGRQLPVSRSSRPETRVRDYWRATPLTISVVNTSTWSR